MPHISDASERVWMKKKINKDDVECPQCKENIGAYEKLPMVRDGGSRACPQCRQVFHLCVSECYGFGNKMGCRACHKRKVSEKTIKARKAGRAVIASKTVKAVYRMREYPELRRRFDELILETLEDEEDVDPELIKGIADRVLDRALK